MGTTINEKGHFYPELWKIKVIRRGLLTPPVCLRQFKSKSHTHTQEHLTPSLMGLLALLLEIWALKKGHEVCLFFVCFLCLLERRILDFPKLTWPYFCPLGTLYCTSFQVNLKLVHSYYYYTTHLIECHVYNNSVSFTRLHYTA